MFIVDNFFNFFKFSLFEEMVNTERKTKELLEISLLEKQNRLQLLNSSAISTMSYDVKYPVLRNQKCSVKIGDTSEILCDVPILNDSNSILINQDHEDSSSINDDSGLSTLSAKK